METPLPLPGHGHMPAAFLALFLENYKKTLGKITAHFCLSFFLSTILISFLVSETSPSSMEISLVVWEIETIVLEMLSSVVSKDDMSFVILVSINSFLVSD